MSIVTRERKIVHQNDAPQNCMKPILIQNLMKSCCYPMNQTKKVRPCWQETCPSTISSAQPNLCQKELETSDVHVRCNDCGWLDSEFWNGSIHVVIQEKLLRPCVPNTHLDSKTLLDKIRSWTWTWLQCLNVFPKCLCSRLPIQKKNKYKFVGCAVEGGGKGYII